MNKMGEIMEYEGEIFIYKYLILTPLPPFQSEGVFVHLFICIFINNYKARSTCQRDTGEAARLVNLIDEPS